MKTSAAGGTGQKSCTYSCQWRLTMNNFTQLVRSLLLDEFKDFDKRVEKLQALWHQDGFGEFLDACFFLAVRRRFTPDQPLVDVIRFVANARVVYDLTGLEIDPGAAERMVRTAMGEAHLLYDIDPYLLRKIQIILVHKLIDDEVLYDDEVDDFLREANALAVRWRTQLAVEALEKLGYTVQLPPPEAAPHNELLAS